MEQNKTNWRLVILAALLVVPAARAAKTEVDMTGIAAFYASDPGSDRTRADAANGIDNNTSTSTYTTASSTGEKTIIALDLGGLHTINQLRVYKFTTNIDGVGMMLDNLDMEILYSTDMGSLNTRTYQRVSNLTNGDMSGAELMTADAVNTDGTISQEHSGVGWWTVTFFPVEATTIAFSGVRPEWDDYPWVHYPVQEYEAYLETLLYAIWPAPSNASRNVDVLTDLSWLAGTDLTNQTVYFGTDPDPSNSPIVASGDSTLETVSNAALDGPLDPNTTYYWKVDGQDTTESSFPGTVWSFTTQIEPITGDLNGDWKVDLIDLSIFAGQWLDTAGCVGHPTDCADIIGDDGVDLLDMACLAENWLMGTFPSVVISEFMASNGTNPSDPDGLLDQDGDSSDWIEIHKLTDLPVSLNGWYLTDKEDEPTKWKFPDIIIMEDYLVVFASGKNLTDPEDELHTNFSLSKDGEYLALIRPDGQTVAWEYTPQFPQQVTDVSYGIYDEQLRYLDVPTPGEENAGPGLIGIVGDPDFSASRGFYENPFDLYLTCQTTGATIRYTLDGSVPTESSTAYTAPISIVNTKCVRAAAFKDGYVQSTTQTHTYIFPANVILQGTLDGVIMNDPVWGVGLDDALLELPSISLVIPYPASTIWTERETSIELIYPDDSKGFQADAGLERFGGDFIGLDKLSFRISFKKIYGPGKLDFDLFGDGAYGGSNATTEFDQILLRGGSHDSFAWGGHNGEKSVYVRNRWVMDRQLEMAQPSPRGRFVNVYINGTYWGQYHLLERPNKYFMSTYYGGEDEDYDVLKADFGQLNPLVGDTDAWYEMLAVADNYENLQQYMDIVNYVDYMLLNFYAGNDNDWWTYHNWIAARKRQPGQGFIFFNWDLDTVLRMNPSNNLVDNSSRGGPGDLWFTVKQFEEVRKIMADRAHKYFFNNGLLTKNSVRAQFDEMAQTIEKTIILESARWGRYAAGYYTPDSWQEGMDLIRTQWADQRTDLVVQQLKNAGIYPLINAPVFNINGSYQHGGYIAEQDELTMTASSEKIYYTLDGSDPRLPSDAINPEAIEINDPGGTYIVPIAQGSQWKYLYDGTDQGTAWRALGFDDSLWAAGDGQLGFGDGDETTDIGPKVDYRFTAYFRHIFNVTDVSNIEDLSINLIYDDGAVIYINGNEIPRVNMPTGTIYYDTPSDGSGGENASAILSGIDSAFLNEGDNILAVEVHQQAYNSSDISFDLGLSIEYSSSTAPTAIPLDRSCVVKARSYDSGQWSALNEAVYAVQSVTDNLRITEIMYHPADPNAEYIELKNISTTIINPALVEFTNGIYFTFPSCQLDPNEYILVAQSPAELAALAPDIPVGVEVLGPYTGSLDNAGEKIVLDDAIGQTIHEFRYEDGWYDITDGEGFSLTVKDPAGTDPNLWDDKSGWRPSAAIGGSPGRDDTGEVPEIGAVKINELLAHSDTEIYDWIELYNTTDASINIGGWYLSDNNNNFKKYTIPVGTVIDANDFYVLYENLHFGVGNPLDPDNVPFALSENGETVYLQSGQGGVLTGYYEEESFGASERDIAFGRYRKSTGTFNFVAMSVNTPGSANAYPKVGPVVINEIMYHPQINPDAEYIELLNISGSSVTLYDYSISEPWQFIDDAGDLTPGLEFYFPTGSPVTMAPGEYLLLVKNLTLFNSEFTPASGVTILEWTTGNLGNGGEEPLLSMPGDLDDGVRQYIRVDKVNYSDGSHPVGDDPWPTEPDGDNGDGSSLSRKVPANYGNDVINWEADTPTPGEAN